MARKTQFVGKVYGTTKMPKEKRVVRRGRYYSVTRDKKGHFRSFRRWSQKRPNRPESKEYVEKYVHTKVKEQLRPEIMKTAGKYDWVDYEDRCYDPFIHRWVSCHE